MRCNCDQRRFQDTFRPNNTYRGQPGYRQDYRGRSRYDSYYRDCYRYNTRGNQRYGRENNNTTEGETLEIKITIGKGVGHMKEQRQKGW